jgi:hypothetical protein
MNKRGACVSSSSASITVETEGGLVIYEYRLEKGEQGAPAQTLKNGALLELKSLLPDVNPNVMHLRKKHDGPERVCQDLDWIQEGEAVVLFCAKGLPAKSTTVPDEPVVHVIFGEEVVDMPYQASLFDVKNAFCQLMELDRSKYDATLVSDSSPKWWDLLPGSTVIVSERPAYFPTAPYEPTKVVFPDYMSCGGGPFVTVNVIFEEKREVVKLVAGHTTVQDLRKATNRYLAQVYDATGRQMLGEEDLTPDGLYEMKYNGGSSG